MSTELARAFLAEGNGFYRLEDRRRVTEDIRRLATAYLALQAENERLREALENIPDYHTSDGCIVIACPVCEALTECRPGADPVVTETSGKAANTHGH